MDTRAYSNCQYFYVLDVSNHSLSNVRRNSYLDTGHTAIVRIPYPLLKNVLR